MRSDALLERKPGLGMHHVENASRAAISVEVTLFVRSERALTSLGGK
jgi:hypothetical protein